MAKREYTHVQELLPEIQRMAEEGMSQREIAEHFGFSSKKVVKELLKRERRKQLGGVPTEECGWCWRKRASTTIRKPYCV